jgi:TatD DNase family protein
MMHFPIIDFHTHSQREQNDIVEVVSVHPNKNKDKNYYTIGYHPWWTPEILNTAELEVLKNAYKNDPFCLGLGEFGLDNLKGAPIDMQEAIFEQQLTIANEVNAPVIIHCVRAFDRLLRMKHNLGQTSWAVHGYVRNKTLAKQILDKGIYLSVAPHGQMNAVFEEMLKYVPLDRIFIETDSETSFNISQRYCIFAALRNLPVAKIQEQLYTNFITFYSSKWKYHIG